MKAKTGTFLPLLAAAALGLAVSARGQTTPGQGQPAPDAGFGEIGSNYAEADFGYLKHDGSPRDLRDYGFTYNKATLAQGIWGLDTGLRYDYLNGSGYGFIDHRSTLEAGPTAYLLQSWGKPFLSADAGYAWQRASGVGRKSFAYSFTSGIEFQAMKQLTVTPFISYDAEPHLYEHEMPTSDFYNREWDYGAKAAYHFTPRWEVTAAIQMDDYNRSDLGYRAGLSYRF